MKVNQLTATLLFLVGVGLFFMQMSMNSNREEVELESFPQNPISGGYSLPSIPDRVIPHYKIRDSVRENEVSGKIRGRHKKIKFKNPVIPEFDEPVKVPMQGQFADFKFKSSVKIRKTVHGKDSDHGDIPRAHGWIGYDDQDALMWHPTPLEKPLSQWTDDEQAEVAVGYKFNTKVCDSIPLDRDFGKGFADNHCKKVVEDYTNSGTIMDNQVSIIFVYHNEALCTLLRSIHSVLNKTPAHYLREIVLIDDGSDWETHPWLGKILHDYLQHVPKIVYHRFAERKGLMGARMAGVENSSGEYLIFLDSHIEAADNWVEPIIGYLAEDYRHAAVPIIDTIKATDFEPKAGGISILGFTWKLGQTGVARKESKYENMETPLMAGGLFGINRKWFEELGGYDHELKQWGGEESEISFKIWMCGGKLVCAPCAHVGHVFRDKIHVKKGDRGVYYTDTNLITRNKLRVSTVWLGEYSSISKLALSTLPKNYTIGDLTASYDVQKKLQCKDFKWYVENVYPEFTVPVLEHARIGALVNVGQKNNCLDIMAAKHLGDTMGVYPCHWQHGTQTFILSRDGNLQAISMSDGALCVGIKYPKLGKDVELTPVKCNVENKWTFNEQTKQMIYNSSGDCLTYKKRKLIPEKCNLQDKFQQFYWVGPTWENFIKGIVD